MSQIVFLFINFIIISSGNILNNKTCNTYKRELGDDQSHFVNCATHNSVPVELCRNCTDFYRNMTKKYEKITQCYEFFDQDRLNVIRSVYEAINEIWLKAFCDDCSVGNHSKDFMKNYGKYEECVKNNAQNACLSCNVEYKELNDYFINLNTETSGRICFDLQDKMNRTRRTWSKILNCCQREQHLTTFTTIACVNLIIIGAFYCTIYGFMKYKEQRYNVLSDEGITTSHRAAPTSAAATATFVSANVNKLE